MSRISLAHAQRGVASVEAILLLPFILLFLVWILVSLRLALVKEHNIIEARTSAWRHSMFNQACQGARTPRYSGWYKGATCATNSVDGETFINALSGGRYEIQFAGVIRGAGVPALSTATARSAYGQLIDPNRALRSFEDSHSVDAGPAWERSQLPAGYARVLPRL